MIITIFLNILKINQKVLTTICLKKRFNFEAFTVLANKLYETKDRNKNND